MGQHMAYGAVAQVTVPPMPARVSPWAVYRLFETRDGQQVFIGITSDKHWEAFCHAFGRPDLLADPELTTNNQRVTARDRLHAELEAFLRTMPLADIVDRCDEARIPFSPIAHPEDLFTDPHLNAGGSLQTVQLPDGRQSNLPRLPMSFGGDRLDLYQEAPEIGEHTRAILSELAYSPAQITTLHEAEVIVAAAPNSQAAHR